MSKLVLITGPSAAGKTTVCKQLLSLVSGVWAYINQDDIRQLVRVGYATADGKEETWSAETKRQWNASIPICIDIAKRYRENEISCVVDFYARPEEFAKWQKYLYGQEYKLFVLMPDIDTVLNRNSDRKRPSKLGSEKVRQAYMPYTDWDEETGQILDSSKMTANEVAARIINLL